MTVLERIVGELGQIERDHEVRVLYACEVGSRAYGFASPDSDYDVRFVFARPLTDYLSVWDPKDHMERSVGDMDLSGWDVRKFLRLMARSNPSVMEWVGSPTVYMEDPRFREAKELAERCFDPVACAWHYYGMLKKQDARYVLAGRTDAKHYLHCVRALLSCEWCVGMRKPVPVPFSELYEHVLRPSLKFRVQTLLDAKVAGVDGPLGRVTELDEWITERMAALPGEISQMSRTAAPGSDVFDAQFRHLLWI